MNIDLSTVFISQYEIPGAQVFFQAPALLARAQSSASSRFAEDTNSCFHQRSREGFSYIRAKPKSKSLGATMARRESAENTIV